MIDLLLVTAPGCRHCDRARTVLDRLAAELPLRWREVPMGSEEGRRLVTRWRAPFPPLLLVREAAGDTLLGYGRLSQRRLMRQLTERRDVDDGQEAAR